MKSNKDHKQVIGKNGLSLPKRVAIIYSDVKREYFPTEDQYITEKDAKKDAILIKNYLEKINVKTSIIPGNSELTNELNKIKPEIVLNLVDSVKGNEYLSSTIPATLELLDIPYTGAGILGKSLEHNKFLVNKVLQQVGVPVPNYQLFNTAEDRLDPTLRFPLISKLNEIHGGVEITKDAVSENEKALRTRLRFLIKTYEQPVLVEEFIVGREITAILLEGLNKKVYCAEKIFTNMKDKYVFIKFEDLWKSDDYNAFRYQQYEDPLLNEYVKKAFNITKMADYSKFDVRMDSSGRYYFIDANCNPAFGPKETSCATSVILDTYGINFFEILKRLLLNTMRDAEGKQRINYTES